jgi:hypothetical protein
MSDNLKAMGASLQDSEFNQFSVFIPETLKFKVPKKGLAARRTPVKFPSEQPTYSTANNRLIRIPFPNDALYDTRNGYLTFNVAITNATGTYVRVHQGIFSLFDRFRIIVSGTEVEDLRDYNRLYSFLWEALNPGQVTSNIGVTVMGFGTQLERNALSAAASTDYACPLFSGVLNTELLPFDSLASGMILELFLEDATQCLESDSPTTPVITISNIKFHVERLDLQEDYRQYIKGYVRSNGLMLGFQTWERYINPLTTGFIQNVVITHRSSSVNGLIHFLVDSSIFASMANNDKFLNWLPLSLATCSTMINGRPFPEEPIDCVTTQRIECFQMYCRWVMKWKLSGFLQIAPSINCAAFQVNRFMLIDDFEPYPEVLDIINPFGTLGNSTSIIKKLNFSLAVPANYQLDTWVEYYRQIRIFSDGSIKVMQ